MFILFLLILKGIKAFFTSPWKGQRQCARVIRGERLFYFLSVSVLVTPLCGLGTQSVFVPLKPTASPSLHIVNPLHICCIESRQKAKHDIASPRKILFLLCMDIRTRFSETLSSCVALQTAFFRRGPSPSRASFLRSPLYVFQGNPTPLSFLESLTTQAAILLFIQGYWPWEMMPVHTCPFA